MKLYIVLFIFLYVLVVLPESYSSQDDNLYQLLESLSVMDDAKLTKWLGELVRREKRGDVTAGGNIFTDKRISNANLANRNQRKIAFRPESVQSVNSEKESIDQITGNNCHGLLRKSREEKKIANSKIKMASKRDVKNNQWNLLEKQDALVNENLMLEGKKRSAEPYYAKRENNLKMNTKENGKLASDLNFDVNQIKNTDKKLVAFTDNLAAKESAKRDANAIQKVSNPSQSADSNEAEYEYYSYADQNANDANVDLSKNKGDTLTGSHYSGGNSDRIINNKQEIEEQHAKTKFSEDSIMGSLSEVMNSNIKGDIKELLADSSANKNINSETSAIKGNIANIDKVKSDMSIKEVPSNDKLNTQDEEMIEKRRVKAAIDEPSASKDYYHSYNYNEEDDYYKEGSENMKNLGRRGRSPKEWDEWGLWSSCSQSCGGGVSVSWRHCIKGPCAPGDKEVRVMYCSLEPCDSKISDDVQSSNYEESETNSPNESNWVDIITE